MGRRFSFRTVFRNIRVVLVVEESDQLKDTDENRLFQIEQFQGQIFDEGCNVLGFFFHNRVRKRLADAGARDKLLDDAVRSIRIRERFR